MRLTQGMSAGVDHRLVDELTKLSRLQHPTAFTAALVNSFRLCMLPPYVTKLLLSFGRETLICWIVVSNSSKLQGLPLSML